jgi:hypothetical protein
MTRLAAMCVVCPVVDAAVVAGVGHQLVRARQWWLGVLGVRTVGFEMHRLVVRGVCGDERMRWCAHVACGMWYWLTWHVCVDLHDVAGTNVCDASGRGCGGWLLGLDVRRYVRVSGG